MKRMFAMAAMAAVFCTGSVAFAAAECKKDDECADPTPVCDVAKVCRARTPAEERSVLDKAKRDEAKEAVKAAETALADAKKECAADAAKCDSPTATPIKSAEQRLVEAKKAAAKVGGGTATAVAGRCQDTHVYACSVEWVKGTCLGSSQILRCPGVLAAIDPQLKGGTSGGAAEARLGRLESRIDEHGKRIGSLEGGQVALADELEQTGEKTDKAYAAAVSDDTREETGQADAASGGGGAPEAEGSAGDVDENQIAGCVKHKARFLKRDKRLKDDAARQNAASTWCLASLNK